MEIGKVNSFYIDSELESGKEFPYAFYFTNATETEFKELLDNYLSENESQGDNNFNVGVFSLYIGKQGYYIHTVRNKVFHRKP